MSSNTYTVEYAKSGRATCKNTKCKVKIEKDVLRIGKKYPSARFTDDGEAVDWYHLNCFFDWMSRARKQTKKLESLEELDGFEHLGDKDQKIVKKCLNGERPPEGGPVLGGGNTTITKTKTTKKTGTKFTAQIVAEDGSVRDLPNGSTILGRGEETGFDDKRCSRQQLELIVDESSQTVKIAQRGNNPSTILRKLAQEPIVMEKDKEFTLFDGDKFHLLLTECPFLVQITTKKATKPKKPKDTVGKSEPTAPSKKKKKGAASDDEEDENEPNEYDYSDGFIVDESKDEDDERSNLQKSWDNWGDESDDEPKLVNERDEDISSLVKEAKAFAKYQDKVTKRKYEQSDESGDNSSQNSQQEYKDGKPVCKYGAACYRRNPQHKRDFWHPADHSDANDDESLSQPTKKPRSQPSDEEANTTITTTTTSTTPSWKKKSTGIDMITNTQLMEDDDDLINDTSTITTTTTSKTSQSLSEKENQAFKNIKELFKDVNEDIILQTLKQNNFDEDATIEALVK